MNRKNLMHRKKHKLLVIVHSSARWVKPAWPANPTFSIFPGDYRAKIFSLLICSLLMHLCLYYKAL